MCGRINSRLGSCLLLLGLVCCSCGPTASRSEGELIGTWEGLSLDAGTGPEDATRIGLVVTPERVVMSRPDGETQVWGDIARVDRSRTPHEINLRGTMGTWLGIFQVEGDRLTLVANDPGQPRPAGFRGSPVGALFVFRRKR
jgi:uncharacterized protein (TIGR03067 family)